MAPFTPGDSDCITFGTDHPRAHAPDKRSYNLDDVGQMAGQKKGCSVYARGPAMTRVEIKARQGNGGKP